MQRIDASAGLSGSATVLSAILIAALFLSPVFALAGSRDSTETHSPLPKIRVAPDGRTFRTAKGGPFVPFGVNYYRPGTSWAPQVWKQFDADATRRDFARIKELGVNCVRVFLSYGAFCTEPGALKPEGLQK